jgi:predicted O-methyltransferase YrrM
MSTSLTEPRIQNLLKSLHSEADRIDPPLLAAAEGKKAHERIALLDRAFIPVDEDAGRFLYALVRGAALTTELLGAKAEAARRSFEQAGLLESIDLRVGDALETLRDMTPDVSVLFLDGWKNLYLPVLQMLEPALLPGALIVADDLNLFPDVLAPYLAYVRHPANGYISVTVPIGDAMELSVRTR